MSKIRSASVQALAALALASMMIMFSGEAEANECSASVSATVVGTSVTLNWSIKNGCAASNYRIYRRDMDDPDSRLQRIAEVDSSVFSYTDSGLAPNTAYRYRIRSVGLNMLSARTDVTTNAPPTATFIPPTPEPTPESARSHASEENECGLGETIPYVSFATPNSAVIEGDSGKKAASVVFTLSEHLNCDVSVRVRVQKNYDLRLIDDPLDAVLELDSSGGSYDYSYLSVNFEPGTTSHTYTFIVYGDTYPESDEQMVLDIISAGFVTVGEVTVEEIDGETVRTAEGTSHIVTIVNDDQFAVSMSSSDVSVAEGEGFTLKIPAPKTNYSVAASANALDEYVEYGGELFSMDLMVTTGSSADDSDWIVWASEIGFPSYYGSDPVTTRAEVQLEIRTLFDDEIEDDETLIFKLKPSDTRSEKFFKPSSDTVTVTIEDNTVEVSNLTVGFHSALLLPQLRRVPRADNCVRDRISPYRDLGFEHPLASGDKPPIWAIISLFEGCSIDVTAVISATPGFPVQMRLAKSGDVNAVRGLPTAFTFDSSNTAETFTVTANQVSSVKTVRLHLTSREGLESFLEGLVIEVIDVE